jgi:hypothetical protein
VSQITSGRETRSQTSVSVEGLCDQADTDRARGRLNAVAVGEEVEGESFGERVARLLGVAVLVGEASVGGGKFPGCDRVETITVIESCWMARERQIDVDI